MFKLRRKNWAMLDTLQRAYLPLAEELLNVDMSQTAVAAISPTGSYDAEGDTVLFPVEECQMYTVVDEPRGGSRSNARIYSVGSIKTEADDRNPWRVTLQWKDVSRHDLTVGPVTYMQQRVELLTDDAYVAPRDGILYHRLENDHIVLSTGLWENNRKIVPIDLIWIPAAMAKFTRLEGFIPTACTHPVNHGRVRAGEILIEFLKPIKHQRAKFGMDREPLLEQNSPLALGRQNAAETCQIVNNMVNTASRLPLDMAAGFHIYEVAYLDEFEQGISSTRWSPKQVPIAAAGLLDSFVGVAPVLFPYDAVVASKTVRNNRLEVTMDDGRVWSLPTAADARIKCQAYEAFEPVGFWTTPGGKPLRSEQLTEADMYAMLFAMINHYGLTRELDGKPVIYAPVGLLGSLAIQHEDGSPRYFVGCNQRLWVTDFGSYLLPAMSYDDRWTLGSYTFDALNIDKQEGKKRRRQRANQFHARMQQERA